jgi:hypothetical protein
LFWTNPSLCLYLEMTVVLLQVVGVASLCCSRLSPAGALARLGRVGYVLTLLGLGVAGAYCGCHQSKFALFAGASMTLLLIGMIAGGGSIDMGSQTRTRIRPGTNLAG